MTSPLGRAHVVPRNRSAVAGMVLPRQENVLAQTEGVARGPRENTREASASHRMRRECLAMGSQLLCGLNLKRVLEVVDLDSD